MKNEGDPRFRHEKSWTKKEAFIEFNIYKTNIG